MHILPLSLFCVSVVTYKSPPGLRTTHHQNLTNFPHAIGLDTDSNCTHAGLEMFIQSFNWYNWVLYIIISALRRREKRRISINISFLIPPGRGTRRSPSFSMITTELSRNVTFYMISLFIESSIYNNIMTNLGIIFPSSWNVLDFNWIKIFLRGAICTVPGYSGHSRLVLVFSDLWILNL